MEPSVEAARSEAEAAVSAADASPAAAPRGAFATPGAKFSLTFAIAAAIILLALFVPTGAPGPKYTDVREITAAPAAFDGKTVAVVGGVKEGSVSVGSALAFNLTDYSDMNESIRVYYAGGPDGSFAEGKNVLVEGRIRIVGGEPRLDADRLSVGCPTDYRPPPQ